MFFKFNLHYICKSITLKNNIMTTKNNNTLPTNTEVVINDVLNVIKNFMLNHANYKVSDMHMENLKVSLNNIANAKKLDILNQINNLK